MLLVETISAATDFDGSGHTAYRQGCFAVITLALVTQHITSIARTHNDLVAPPPLRVGGAVRFDVGRLLLLADFHLADLLRCPHPDVTFRQRRCGSRRIDAHHQPGLRREELVSASRVNLAELGDLAAPDLAD